MDTITEFKGRYFFLSNYYEAPVKYRGIVFKNNEAAFQSMKCPKRFAEFATLSPSEAKQLGRKVQLREDWEARKIGVMYRICKAKFTQNKELGDKLISTGDALLIEGNDWNDKIWGVCDGEGRNLLGKILMQVRKELIRASNRK